MTKDSLGKIWVNDSIIGMGMRPLLKKSERIQMVCIRPCQLGKKKSVSRASSIFHSILACRTIVEKIVVCLLGE